MCGHLPEAYDWRWPFTGGGTRPGGYHASAIYRKSMTGAGHLPEVGTRPGRYPPGEGACVGHFYRAGGRP